MKDDRIIVNAILLLICLVTLLKLLHNVYLKKNSVSVDVDKLMLQECPSYQEFRAVSLAASPPNNPKRASGDFYDYVFDSLEDVNNIESKILKIRGV